MLRSWRAGKRFFASDSGGRSAQLVRKRLTAGPGMVAMLVCAVPLALGFVFPAGELARLAYIAGDPLWGGCAFTNSSSTA